MVTPCLFINKMDIPQIFVVMAMSADGKIATENRMIQTFGSKKDHDRLMRLRTTADAVMSGSTTINTAAYDLGPGGHEYRNLRIQNNLNEYNIRIVVSGTGSIDPKAEIFNHTFSPIIILTTDLCTSSKRNQLEKVTPHIQSFGETKIDWFQALKYLKKTWNIDRIACEGGGHLNDELIHGGWVDTVYLTISPVLVRGRNSPTICDGAGVPHLDLAKQFSLEKLEKSEKEIFLEYRKTNRS